MIESSIQEQKMAKAYTILTKGDKPTQVNNETFTVPSQSGNWLYNVILKSDEWHCDCPDHNKRDADCKHVYTVKFWLNSKDNLKEEVKDSKPLNFHSCDKCGSHSIVKNGSRTTKQGKKTRLLCKACNHTFVLEDDGFYNMKFDSEIVTLCLDLYFKGVSLRKIEHHIKQFRGITVDHSTIHVWIKKYTEIISAYVDTLKPVLGDMWAVDEMKFKVKHGGLPGKKGLKTEWVWLWNMMDNDTRFLISNLVSRRKGVGVAITLFRDVRAKVGKPKFVVSDGMRSYHKAFNKVFWDYYRSCKHISEVGLRDKVNNNRVERLHGTIRDREKVMRALGNPESSKKILDGHKVYYNYVRPHMAPDGKTPAEMAGLDLNLGENKWHGLIKKSIESGIEPKGFEWKHEDQESFNQWKNVLKTSGKPELKKKDKGRLDYWV